MSGTEVRDAAAAMPLPRSAPASPEQAVSVRVSATLLPAESKLEDEKPMEEQQEPAAVKLSEEKPAEAKRKSSEAKAAGKGPGSPASIANSPVRAGQKVVLAGAPVKFLEQMWEKEEAEKARAAEAAQRRAADDERRAAEDAQGKKLNALWRQVSKLRKANKSGERAIEEMQEQEEELTQQQEQAHARFAEQTQAEEARLEAGRAEIARKVAEAEQGAGDFRRQAAEAAAAEPAALEDAAAAARALRAARNEAEERLRPAKATLEAAEEKLRAAEEAGARKVAEAAQRMASIEQPYVDVLAEKQKQLKRRWRLIENGDCGHEELAECDGCMKKIRKQVSEKYKGEQAAVDEDYKAAEDGLATAKALLKERTAAMDATVRKRDHVRAQLKQYEAEVAARAEEVRASNARAAKAAGDAEAGVHIDALRGREAALREELGAVAAEAEEKAARAAAAQKEAASGDAAADAAAAQSAAVAAAEKELADVRGAAAARVEALAGPALELRAELTRGLVWERAAAKMAEAAFKAGSKELDAVYRKLAKRGIPMPPKPVMKRPREEDDVSGAKKKDKKT